METLPNLLQDTAFDVPFVDDGQALPQVVDIEVPHQDESQWCWCAVTVGVNHHFDKSFALSQCQTAAIVLGVADACSRPGDDDINTLFALDDSLKKFGHLKAMKVGSLPFAAIRQEIDDKRPVGVRILFLETGTAHFTVIRGYRTEPVPILLIDDPLYDESEWSYQEFVASYKGSGEWRHSYLTQ